jgi:hypothetical protein
MASLIITHNNRMRCLLGKLGIEPRYNFQKCSVLKITVRPGKAIIRLLYSGDMAPGDSPVPFYSNTNFLYKSSNKVVVDIARTLVLHPYKINVPIKNLDGPIGDDLVSYDYRGGTKPEVDEVFYDTIEEIEDSYEDAKVSIEEIEGPKHIFYIVRNGKGSLMTSIHKMVLRINKDLVLKKNKINTVFVSDLAETMETYKNMRTIIVSLNLTTMFPRINTEGMKYDMRPSEIIVLPCSHEVSSIGTGGNCESMFDTSATCKIDQLNRVDMCKADWSYYEWFYNNRMRGSLFGKSGNRCRDTNMLYSALLYFAYKVIDDEIKNKHRGGTRKHKRTRSKRKPRSKRR